MKREISETPSPAPTSTPSPDEAAKPGPTTPTKKARSDKTTAGSTTPKTATKAKTPGSSSGGSSGRTLLSNADKRRILVRGMEILARELPFRELAEELGIPESRLKDQFKANRSNLRRTVEELYANE